jgi:hypothetical protein
MTNATSNGKDNQGWTDGRSSCVNGNGVFKHAHGRSNAKGDPDHDKDKDSEWDRIKDKYKDWRQDPRQEQKKTKYDKPYERRWCSFTPRKGRKPAATHLPQCIRGSTVFGWTCFYQFLDNNLY